MAVSVIILVICQKQNDMYVLGGKLAHIRKQIKPPMEDIF